MAPGDEFIDVSVIILGLMAENNSDRRLITSKPRGTVALSDQLRAIPGRRGVRGFQSRFADNAEELDMT